MLENFFAKYLRNVFKYPLLTSNKHPLKNIKKKKQLLNNSRLYPWEIFFKILE